VALDRSPSSRRLALRGPRPTISPAYLRLAAMVAGPLFLYSALAAFGGGHHH
jgi:hypothetical protein